MLAFLLFEKLCRISNMVRLDAFYVVPGTGGVARMDSIKLCSDNSDVISLYGILINVMFSYTHAGMYTYAPTPHIYTHTIYIYINN